MISTLQIITGKWRENCYIVKNDKHYALLIDPGDEPEKIINIITNEDLEPLAIINTHAHYDHIGAIDKIKNHFGIPFYIHSLEKSNLRNVNLYRKMLDGSEPISIPKVDKFIDKLNNPMKIGNFEIEVFFSPGHSAGSVCFLIENNLFTGDMLYKNKIGRIDFPGGNKDLLRKSLIEICKLPEETIIFPGHGEKTTMKEVLQENIELKKVVQ